jgi:hypothetical protein
MHCDAVADRLDGGARDNLMNQETNELPLVAILLGISLLALHIFVWLKLSAVI